MKDKRYRVATVILLRNDGAAVMQLRDDKVGLPRAGMWVTPGGHREPNETDHQCALREFYEETGYQCSQLTYLATRDDINTVTGQTYDLVIYWSRYDAQQSLSCLEGQELRFVKREEAQQLGVPEILVKAWDEAILASRVRESEARLAS